MRVLEGPGETEQGGQSGTLSGEASYGQGYQQAALWSEPIDVYGAVTTEKAEAGIDMDRVPVVNTKSGRLICGAAAPMKKNLGIYLRDRPYMQVFDSLSTASGSSTGKKRVHDSDADLQDSTSGARTEGQDVRGGQMERIARKVGEGTSGTAARKRSKTVSSEAMDHEVLSALETWSDAMQEASDMLDKESCSSVLEELLALHERVQTKQTIGDLASLRALVLSQFPKTCLDILHSIGDFDTMRLTECVTAALNIDQQMSDGKNLGDEELSALGRDKILELDKLGQRTDQLSKEFEEIRKQEEEAIVHHTNELNKTRKAIQKLQDQQADLMAKLEAVNTEAAHHLQVLQTFEGGAAEGAAEVPEGLSVAPNVEGDAVQQEMSELLKSRGAVDRARDGVNAAQAHLDLMHHVCEFSAEVRNCLEGYCTRELLQALQRELEVLRQDKAKVEHIAEQLREMAREEEAGAEVQVRSGVSRSASLRDKYKRFYAERIQDMRSKHFKTRHAASGLVAYFDADAAAECSAEARQEVQRVVLHAKEIVSLVDALQKTTDDSAPTVEPVGTVSPERAGASLVLYPCNDGGVLRAGSLSKSIEHLSKLAQRPTLQGRLVVRGSERAAGPELCGVIDAVQGGVGASSGGMAAAAAAAGCVCDALDEVCTAKARTALCLVPYVVLQAGAGSPDGYAAGGTASFPVLAAALLHARVEHSWMQRIAVVDLLQPASAVQPWVDAQITQTSPVTAAAKPPEFKPELLVSREQSAAGGAGQERRSEDSGAKEDVASFVERWQEGMEKVVVPALAACKPQLIVVSIESVLHLAAARNARALSAHNFLWAGRFLAERAAPFANGRMVVVWGVAGGSTWVHRSVHDFVRGMVEAHGAA